MSARVAVLGLDAADAGLIERWAADGSLPHFRELMRRSATFRLGNSLETLPGAIWPELSTGISAGRAPFYFHPRQLHTGEATVRPVEAQEIDPDSQFWVQAARHGRLVAAIDMPQSVPAQGLKGIQLQEWGLHDRAFAIASQPPELLDAVRARWGDHPVRDCDGHDGTRAGFDALLAALKRGVRLKVDLLVEMLRSESWDLFSACVGESHCVGHHFWHFDDPRHPKYEPDAPPHLRNAVRDIYAEIDAGLGRLVAELDPSTTLLVVASHGMGLYTGGPKLLPEFLERIGMSESGDSRMRRELQARYLVRHLPRRWLPALRALSARSGVRRTRQALGGLRKDLESPRTRAAALENNRCGAIRLNLAGREPHGCVEPGPEARETCETIRRHLLALRDVASGECVVERVVLASEAFGPDVHPDVPDVMVVFRTDLGILEHVRSDRTGEFQVSNEVPGCPRSGDHGIESRLWASGPGIEPGISDATGNVLDLAPSVLQRLGLTPPRGLDGRPLFT